MQSPSFILSLSWCPSEDARRGLRDWGRGEVDDRCGGEEEEAGLLAGQELFLKGRADPKFLVFMSRLAERWKWPEVARAYLDAWM